MIYNVINNKSGIYCIKNTLKFNLYNSNKKIGKRNEWQVRIIKKLLDIGYMKVYQIAEIFNVSKTTIFDILSGRIWSKI